MQLMQPKILKTYVIAGGGIHTVDTIEHEGKLWLVPNWLDDLAEGVTMPSRIIRLDVLRYERMGTEGFALRDPMPKALLERRTPPKPIPGYEYQELPDIRFPLARSSH